jgi:formylglycine-generating enzyme required for sulfatase activity
MKKIIVCIAATAMILGLVMTSGIVGKRSSAPPADVQSQLAEPEMVFVEGGTFTMGCTSEQESDCDSDEKPAHSVTVSSFSIGKCEITLAQWKTIMGNNPSKFQGDDLPVERVSWEEAQEFISRLNKATGKKYRLPTEAEWEYAARGGTKNRNYKYSGSNSIDEVAWYEDNSGDKTHPVGTKKANELGIYDMNGNIWEWCNDWYGNYDSSAQTNPVGALSGSYRVIRGGSWNYYAYGCRVANRLRYSPGFRNTRIGFRIACSSE